MHGKGMPATPRHNLPHVYQTLQHLARHPRIDGARIGILGVSYGGTIALLTSSDELTREHTGGKLRFAAHLPIYPVCWRHSRILAGTTTWQFKRTVYQRVTGRPVHILAGDKDDYDDDPTAVRVPGGVATAGSPVLRPHGLPGATFGWDSPFGRLTWDAGAKRARGAPDDRRESGDRPTVPSLRGRVLHGARPALGTASTRDPTSPADVSRKLPLRRGHLRDPQRLRRAHHLRLLDLPAEERADGEGPRDPSSRCCPAKDRSPSTGSTRGPRATTSARCAASTRSTASASRRTTSASTCTASRDSIPRASPSAEPMARR